MRRFADRSDAGRRLGELLSERAWHDPLVVGLPRGGVVVAVEVARALGCACEAYVAGKLPAPGHQEYALGPVSEDGDVLWGADATTLLPSPDARDDLVAATLTEVRRRVEAYRRGRPLPDLARRNVLCVDDGLATGLTARAAVAGLRGHGPASVVVAVPVAVPSAADDLAEYADEVVAVLTPSRFSAVGAWYRDFRQVTDAEVRAALAP